MADGRTALAAEGVTGERAVVTLACDVRYVGQYHEITVPWSADEAPPDLAGVAKRFHEAHDRLYGYALPGTALELVNVRVAATGVTPKPPLPDVPPGHAEESRRGRDSSRRGHRRAWIPEERAFVDVAVYDGERLGRGARLVGPAVIELEGTTVWVGPGWHLEADRHGSFLMARA